MVESQSLDPSVRPLIRSKIKAQTRDQILEKAELIMDLVKQKLFTHFPMWRPFWSKMPPIASFGAGSIDTDGFGTMCTTGTAIFYCPFFVVEQYELGKVAFVNEFTGGEAPKAIEAIRSGVRHPMDYSLFVIIHEILHCSLKHHIRTPYFESEHISKQELHYFWNIAADYEINHTLLEDIKSELYVMPVGGVRADAAGGQFAVDPEDLEFFTKKSAEQIFYRLVKNVEEKRKQKKKEEEKQKEEEKEQEKPESTPEPQQNKQSTPDQNEQPDQKQSMPDQNEQPDQQENDIDQEDQQENDLDQEDEFEDDDDLSSEEPGQAGGEQSDETGKPTPGEQTPDPSGKPTGPSQVKERGLSEEEKLSDEYVEKIIDQVESAVTGEGKPWNIGEVPSQGNPTPDIGEPASPLGDDARIWVDPAALDEQVDRLNREAEQQARLEDEKEEKSSGVKGVGKGKGRGRVRDRLAIEQLSKTNWAAIFKTRLKAYSSEKGGSIPYERRLLSSPIAGRRISSKVQKKDVLPELNLLIDTSASMSFRELSIILGEIKSAMEQAKIKTLNIFLWHDEPYEWKTFSDVKSGDFGKVSEWITGNWRSGGTQTVPLYRKIVQVGKAKKFTIMLTDGYFEDHRQPNIKSEWTKALDPAETIFAITFPSKSTPFAKWEDISGRLPGTKVPIFLDTEKFS